MGTQRVILRKTMSLVVLLEGYECAALNSPVLLENTEACLSPRRGCQQQQHRTAGMPKLLLSALEPRTAELLSHDYLLDPSTCLSYHRVQIETFFLFSVKEKAAGRNVFINTSCSPQVPPELTVLLTSACKTSAVPSLFFLPQRKSQCFILLS